MDAEKCFDKLWLKDSILEMIQAGHDINDAIMIYRMNKEAEVVIDTPVGTTEEFLVEETVRQGTIYGPPLCCISTDKINMMTNKPSYVYNADLVIEALTYVDDILGAGNHEMVRNVVRNASEMEQKKKFTFNIDKSNYLVLKTGNDEEKEVTEKVKMGYLKKVKEYKYLGTWMNEKYDCSTHISKINEKVSSIIVTIKSFANGGVIGNYSVEARLHLFNTVVINFITYNIEAWTQMKKCEVDGFEKIQGRVLRSLLEVPISTPYLGILMETGVWPITYVIDYKKIVLLHQIMNSNDGRLLKRIILEQSKQVYANWYNSVKTLCESYGIDISYENLLNHSKKKWKTYVKKIINGKVTEYLQQLCNRMKKLRHVVNDKYERKSYLVKGGKDQVRTMLMVRLNMVDVKSNYKNGNNDLVCPLCRVEEDTTEHIFECKETKMIRELEGIEKSDIYEKDDMNRIRVIERYVNEVMKRRKLKM